MYLSSASREPFRVYEFGNNVILAGFHSILITPEHNAPRAEAVTQRRRWRSDVAQPEVLISMQASIRCAEGARVSAVRSRFWRRTLVFEDEEVTVKKPPWDPMETKQQGSLLLGSKGLP